MFYPPVPFALSNADSAKLFLLLILYAAQMPVHISLSFEAGYAKPQFYLFFCFLKVDGLLFP
jgi:hypothetical protein